MRALVIGGTGFNGRRIVARLLERGHQVSVISRGELPSTWREGVAHIRVDRKDTRAFASACAGLEFDALIDNIAYTPADARSALEAFGTRIGQYLFTSTMAVYHDLLQRTRPIGEDEVDLDYRPGPDEGLQTALHPTRGHAYAIEKREVEQVVRQASVPWTALRASMIVGPDDWVGVVWWWVQRILDGGPILVPDTGHGHAFQVTYVEDLADAFVAALGNPVAPARLQRGRDRTCSQPRVSPTRSPRRSARASAACACRRPSSPRRGLMTTGCHSPAYRLDTFCSTPAVRNTS